MSLLELAHISKRYGRASAERVTLRDVSLQIEAGEFVAVWGRRRSGRSTLLRIAAGLETPDEGVVSFDGHDLADPRSEALRSGIRYCRKSFRPAGGPFVLDQLTTSQLTRGVSLSLARERAGEALVRVGAARCAAVRPGELDSEEITRVVIARALVNAPKMIVIDEPTLGVEIAARDGILSLLRSLADDSIAVLASATETTGLAGADRALSLAKGSLRGELDALELAPVVPLRSASA